MTLTYNLDLDNLPLDLHAKIQVCMSVRLEVRVVTADRHTHKDDVKTITPDTSQMWGVKMNSFIPYNELRLGSNRCTSF